MRTIAIVISLLTAGFLFAETEDDLIADIVRTQTENIKLMREGSDLQLQIWRCAP